MKFKEGDRVICVKVILNEEEHLLDKEGTISSIVHPENDYDYWVKFDGGLEGSEITTDGATRMSEYELAKAGVRFV